MTFRFGVWLPVLDPMDGELSEVGSPMVDADRFLANKSTPGPWNHFRRTVALSSGEVCTLATIVLLHLNRNKVIALSDSNRFHEYRLFFIALNGEKSLWQNWTLRHWHGGCKDRILTRSLKLLRLFFLIK